MRAETNCRLEMVSFYEDEVALEVLAELDGVSPVLDCVTGKRGNEHRRSDKPTKRKPPSGLPEGIGLVN